MTNEFIPYNQALALKELGFDESCFTYYYEDTGKIRTGLSIHIHNGWTYSGTKRLETTLAPTFSQAFRWFREKYGDFLRHDWGEVPHFLMIQIEMTKGKTYEEAELACLRKLIEIVKNK